MGMSSIMHYRIINGKFSISHKEPMELIDKGLIIVPSQKVMAKNIIRWIYTAKWFTF